MADEWMSVEALPLSPLTGDQVQIWRVGLPHSDTPPEDYFHLLSAEEQARSQRLRHGRVRLQFVVARACLRVLLGNALDLDPTLVPITLSSFGKPETPGVFYNLAHSGATILIALCRSHSVGIDIEYVTREVDALEIAKTSFSASEHRALALIDEEARLQQAFFRCWTRKEAVIKADGRGLSLALDSFDVPVTVPAIDTPVLMPVSHESAVCHYYVSDIALEDDVAAACAVSVPHLALAKFSFDLQMIARAQ